jgi:1-acyl-sn-glycerol-3-phosphate acyltransferase
MERAFDSIAKELREGEIVCIFPEGKLTGSGEMNPFRAGIDRILRETPVPVVPMALSGLWGSMFSRQQRRGVKLPRRFRSRLTLNIGPVVPAAEANAAALEERVRGLLSETPLGAA